MKTSHLLIAGAALFFLMQRRAQAQQLAAANANANRVPPLTNNQNTAFWVAQGLPVARDLVSMLFSSNTNTAPATQQAVLDSPKNVGSYSDLISAGLSWVSGGNSPADETAWI